MIIPATSSGSYCSSAILFNIFYYNTYCVFQINNLYEQSYSLDYNIYVHNVSYKMNFDSADCSSSDNFKSETLYILIELLGISIVVILLL